MRTNVLDHEPHLALFVSDDDPLVFYRAVSRWAQALLRPGGFGIVEINEALGPETAAVFKADGFVDVKDVVRAMITLMENNRFGQRYCLNGTLISYKDLFNLMAENFKVKAPYIKVGKALSEVAWRIFWLIGKIKGKKPLITKETARTSTRKYSYSSAKIINELNFKFTPIEQSVKEICEIYLNE